MLPAVVPDVFTLVAFTGRMIPAGRPTKVTELPSAMTTDASPVVPMYKALHTENAVLIVTATADTAGRLLLMLVGPAMIHLTGCDKSHRH
jgi:hypothetical protein